MTRVVDVEGYLFLTDEGMHPDGIVISDTSELDVAQAASDVGSNGYLDRIIVDAMMPYSLMHYQNSSNWKCGKVRITIDLIEVAA